MDTQNANHFKSQGKVKKYLSCSCIMLIFVFFAIIAVFISGFFNGMVNLVKPADAIIRYGISNSFDGSASHKILCKASMTGSPHWYNLDCKCINSEGEFGCTASNLNNSGENEEHNESNGTNSSSDNSALSQRENEITSIIEASSPAVVTVVAKTYYQDYFNDQLVERSNNIGSGFIISADGYIITNKHVVDDTNYEYEVLIAGEKEPIQIENFALDPDNDIAILKVNKSNLPFLKLGNSHALKKGQTVIAIGSPLGDLTDTVTVGVVSGLNRDISVSDTYGQSMETIKGAIQTDAAINHGNSGGPLIDINGNVVGVNVATSENASNVSFALPISIVQTKYSEYRQFGKFLSPYIGINYKQQAFLLPDGTNIYGALITQISSQSPASKAGLRRGDLIVEADNRSLDNINLQIIIQSKKAGEELNLKVYRNKEFVNLQVVVENRQ